jgi:transcriptional regulator with XRE-family HTH domain
VTQSPGLVPSIKQESRVYFRALGIRITQLRKERGMTQAELARAIGVSQQSVFAYELGDRRVSVLILAKLSKVFSISVEQLMGMTTPAPLRKRRLSPRAMRHAERIQGLSKTQQRFVVRIIDVLEDSRPRG